MRWRLTLSLSICMMLFYTLGNLGVLNANSASTELTGANLVENGRFQNGLNGWEDWGNTAVLEQTVNGQSMNAVKIGEDEGGMGYYISSQPGETYELSGWGKAESASVPAMLIVKSLSGHNKILAQLDFTGSQYEKGVKTFTVPQGVTELIVYVYKNPGEGFGYVTDISVVPSAAEPAKQVHNHAYLPEEWISDPQTDAFIAAKVNEMKSYAIEYQFNNIGTLQEDGSINLDNIKEFGHWIKVSRETDPNQKIIAWVNGSTTEHAQAPDSDLRQTIIDSVSNLVKNGLEYQGKIYKVDGVHFDIEPLRSQWKDDPQLLSLMQDVRSALGANVHLSIAAPAWDVVWSNGYITQMANVVDMLNPMIYDTQGHVSDKPYITETKTEYEQLWKKAALRYSAAIAASSNPDCQYAPIMPAYERKGEWNEKFNQYVIHHDPFIENIYHAARGLKQAMAEGANVYGSGVFWWELFISQTPDPRDNQDYSHARGWWMTEWVNQGVSTDIPAPLPDR